MKNSFTRICVVSTLILVTFFVVVEKIGATGLLRSHKNTITALGKRTRPLPSSTPVGIIPSDKPQVYQMPLASPFTFPPDAGPKPEFKADANSPVIWEGNTLIMFNSAGSPWRSTGPDIEHMSPTEQVTIKNGVGSGQWLEAVVRDDSTGYYYGYYHNEPGDFCNGLKTVPRIGAMRSTDQGVTWQDQGIIMEGVGNIYCNTANGYFAGGHGDFTVMLDQERRNLYFFFSNYEDVWEEQGVSMAVMEWRNRDRPVGAVRKLFNGNFSQPGLKGGATPINEYFGIQGSWHDLNTNAFWGPSVHFNEHLQQYVMLLNHAVRSDIWLQEGIYISFSPTLEDPSQWTKPVRIVEGGVWYPQIIGATIGSGTDKLSGQKAYFFQGGVATSMLCFIRPGETTPCN
jgi:hypothetical protein